MSVLTLTANGSTYQFESFAQAEAPTDEGDLIAQRELAERLGLTAQLKRMSSPNGTNNPFPVCETSTLRIINVVCPNKTRLAEFDDELIPLRVLQTIDLAKNSGLTTFHVHHPAYVKDDPFILGYESDRYDARPFLIARWGKHLKSFAELRTDACALLTSQANAAIVELEGVIKLLKSKEIYTIPSWASRPHISVSLHS